MILIKFERSIQVTQDEYRLVWEEKAFNENATLKEVMEWVNENNKQNLNVTLSEITN